MMFQRNATITGALLAIGSIVTLMLMPRPYAREILAIVLAGLGGFYAGLGLAAADPKKFSIQAGVSVIFVALSLAGLWLSPRLPRARRLGHGSSPQPPQHLRPRVVRTHVPRVRHPRGSLYSRLVVRRSDACHLTRRCTRPACASSTDGPVGFD